MLPDSINGLPTLPQALTLELGNYLSRKGYPLDQIGREPPEELFTPPLVLWNHGFTDAAFFEYRVRYRHVLHSVSGLAADSDYLLFLACVLRSPLARYFMFHTAASWATERDQVQNSEALRLPFYLPDSEDARPDAASILADVAARLRRFMDEMEKRAIALVERSKRPRLGPLFDRDSDQDGETNNLQRFLEQQRQEAAKLQAELNPLIYDYFGVNPATERALIEDTVEIFDRSDTPSSLSSARNIPTVQPVDADGLEPYASMLTRTLNGWASGALRVDAAGGVDAKLGLGLVELSQARKPRDFQIRDISDALATALKGLLDANIEQWGHLEFRRSGLIFDGAKIYVLKPAVRGEWTRTAALNDAAELSAHIAQARLRAKTG